MSLSEAKQASFHAKKKTNFFIRAKCLNQGHDTCKHYRMFSCSSHFVRDVNKAGSFKAKVKAKAKARSLKAKTKAKARDQG